MNFSSKFKVKEKEVYKDNVWTDLYDPYSRFYAMCMKMHMKNSEAPSVCSVCGWLVGGNNNCVLNLCGNPYKHNNKKIWRGSTMKTDLKDAFCEDVNRVELFYSGVRQRLVLVLSNFAFCYFSFFVCSLYNVNVETVQDW